MESVEYDTAVGVFLLVAGSRPLARARGLYLRERGGGILKGGRMATDYRNDWCSLLVGDVRARLADVAAGSVQTVVTSPPYWGLRAYGTNPQIWGGDPNCQHQWPEPVKSSVRIRNGAKGGLHEGRETNKMESTTLLNPDVCGVCGVCGACGAWRGELGSEPTPEQFIANMVAVFRTVWRVLRDDGCIWVNIGDSYAQSGMGGNPEESEFRKQATNAGSLINGRKPPPGLKPKDLCGIPWRLAFALQASGWYLRSEIIWAKPNPMPESVTDRPSKAHETVFLLAKRDRYYFDQEAVREESSDKQGRVISDEADGAWRVENGRLESWREKEYGAPANGRNIRSVWTIPTQSFSEAHFACVDDKTEALTKRGWLGCNDVRDGDEIASFDGERLSWKPASFHLYPFDGELVAVESRDLSMRLTDNHRVVCRGYKGKGAWGIREASTLIRGLEIPTAAPFTMLGVGERIDEAFAELCGWVLTDGGFNEGNSITVYQSEERGKHERVESVFERLGIKPSIHRRQRDRKPELAFSFSGKFAADIRRLFPDKEGSFDVLWKWDAESLLSLWTGLVAGDGNTRDDGRITFVGSLVKVDFFQALCASLGMTCRLAPKAGSNGWAAFVSRKKEVSLRGTNSQGGNISRETYSGIVWCPNVENGMWLARRNGRPFITGNTYPEKLVEPCIKAGTSEKGCCEACGAPWRRVVEKERRATRPGEATKVKTPGRNSRVFQDRDPAHPNGRKERDDYLDTSVVGNRDPERHVTESRTVGWEASCTCNAGIVPCRVLDPFTGSGTTGLVARKLGRHFIGTELSETYAEMAWRRMNAPTKADVPKVKPCEGQLPLFT